MSKRNQDTINKHDSSVGKGQDLRAGPPSTNDIAVRTIAHLSNFFIEKRINKHGLLQDSPPIAQIGRL